MQLDIQITDQDLPVLSAVASQALEMIQSPDATNRRIEELIRQDPSLTERVLRTANSPFYGGRFQISTISDGIVRLGLRQLHNVVIVAATGELFSDQDPVIQQFWDKAIASALASHQLADMLQVAHAEESFIAGMLHDVGQLIIYRQHPEVYRQLLAEAQSSGRPLFEIENDNFQYFNHMTIGGLVVRKWKLSENVAEAARFHHELERQLPPGLQFTPLACIVSLAGAVVEDLNFSQPLANPERFAQLACAQELRVSLQQIQTLHANVGEAFAVQRNGVN